MNQTAAEPPQVALIRVDQASVAKSAKSALGRGPSGHGMTFAGHGLASRVAVSPPRNVFWTRVCSFSVWESEADLDEAERVWQKGHQVIDPDRMSPTQHDGPVISVTYSEAIPRHVNAFLKTSRPVEEQVLKADGMLWTMGFFKPPMWFSTITIWESGEATDAFAYSGAGGGAHRLAMPKVHDWFRRSTTMRFRPYDVRGSLSGELALDESAFSRR